MIKIPKGKIKILVKNIYKIFIFSYNYKIFYFSMYKNHVKVCKKDNSLDNI